MSRAFSAPEGLTTNQGFDGHLADHCACTAESEARPSGTADDYNGTDDFAKSIEFAYRVIRERVSNGGPGWTQAKYPKT